MEEEEIRVTENRESTMTANDVVHFHCQLSVIRSTLGSEDSGRTLVGCPHEENFAIREDFFQGHDPVDGAARAIDVQDDQLLAFG